MGLEGGESGLSRPFGGPGPPQPGRGFGTPRGFSVTDVSGVAAYQHPAYRVTAVKGKLLTRNIPFEVEHFNGLTDKTDVDEGELDSMPPTYLRDPADLLPGVSRKVLDSPQAKHVKPDELPYETVRDADARRQRKYAQFPLPWVIGRDAEAAHATGFPDRAREKDTGGDDFRIVAPLTVHLQED